MYTKISKTNPTWLSLTFKCFVLFAEKYYFDVSIYNSLFDFNWLPNLKEAKELHKDILFLFQRLKSKFWTV